MGHMAATINKPMSAPLMGGVAHEAPLTAYWCNRPNIKKKYIYGSMEGEIRERAIQGRKVTGSFGPVMRERTVSREVKKALRDSITVLTVAYASET